MNPMKIWGVSFPPVTKIKPIIMLEIIPTEFPLNTQSAASSWFLPPGRYSITEWPDVDSSLPLSSASL